jgi:hypothetical protein
MPLSERQHQQMTRHIRAHTSYTWSSRQHLTPLNYIVESLERMLDAKRGFTRDLFLPDELINEGTDRASFWFRMARLMTAAEEGGEWHELETRRRMVFTWRGEHGTYRFYTKGLLSGGARRDLVWYASKASACADDEAVHSGDDTDSEDIDTRVVP